MTDPTHDRSDARWFRAQVGPVVDAEPVPDAWDQIAARVEGGVVPASATPRRSGRPRWLAAAAVVVVLAGLVGLSVLVVGGDADSDLTTTAPASTGWYVPVGLPDGWSLVRAEVGEGRYCETAERRWKQRPGTAEERPTLELAYDSCGTPDQPAGGRPGPSLGSGTSASFLVPAGDGPTNQLTWAADGSWRLTGTGITDDQLVDAAQAIAADPITSGPPIPGFESTGGGGSYGGDPDRPGPLFVSVEMRAPDGSTARYHLHPAGDARSSSPFRILEPHPLAGQPEPFARWQLSVDGTEGTLASRSGRLVGEWPGADVHVDLRVVPASEDVDLADERVLEAHDELVDALAASLRPATAERWQAFLATASEANDDPRLRAASLERMGEATDPAVTATTARAATTDPDDEPGGSAPTSSTTVAPTMPGPALSEPATVGAPTDGVPRDQFSDLTGLRVRLRLPTRTMSATEPTPGALLIENTTDRTITLDECTSMLTRWGLLPRGERGQLPRKVIIDCFDTPTTTIEAGRTATVPLEWGRGSGFTARTLDLESASQRFLGSLPPGPYTAIAVLPGSTGDIRVELPVTVPTPPCPMSDEEAVRYRDRPYAEAVAAAQADGRHLAVLSNDGKATDTGWNLDCTRVRAIVELGIVVDYTFG